MGDDAFEAKVKEYTSQARVWSQQKSYSVQNVQTVAQDQKDTSSQGHA